MKGLDRDALLVVEDDADGRQIISMMLGMRLPRVRLIVAEDGPSALRAFAEYLPAIVITDLNMPGMSGIDLVGEIGKIRNGVRFIVLTAFSDRVALDACRAAGVAIDHCVPKPIDYGKLMAAIECCRSAISSPAPPA